MEFLPDLLDTQVMNEATNEARVNAFTREMLRQRDRPPGGDEIIQAFWSGALKEFEDGGQFARLIHEFVLFRNVQLQSETDGMSPSEAAGAFRAAIQADLTLYVDDFPANPDYLRSDHWQEIFRHVPEVLDDTSDTNNPRQEALSYRLAFMNVQTTVPSRYALPEIVMQAVKNRFPEGITWWDIGSGAVLGPRQLVFKDKYPFENVNAGDITATKLANAALAAKSVLRHCVAIDLLPYDSNTVLNARASLRPQKEILNEAFINRFDGLAKEPLKNIQTVDCDISNPQEVARLDSHTGSERPQVVTLITAAHQMNKEGVLQPALKNIQQRLDENGIIILQDFVHLSRDREKRLAFYQRWHQPGRYRTLVFDAANPERQWQTLITSEDSRALQIRFASGKLALEGATVTLPELL